MKYSKKDLIKFDNELIRRKEEYYQKLRSEKQAPQFLPVKTASTVNYGGEMKLNPHEHALMKQIKMLDQRIHNTKLTYQKYDRLAKEAKARNDGNLITNDSAADLAYNIQQREGNVLLPGNVGQLNEVIWPFYYTARDQDRDIPTLAPGTSVLSSYTVTQEAAFVIMSYQKAVFLVDPQTGDVSYIDPGQPDAAAKSNGLSVSFRDAQSSRVFNDEPTDINQLGFWKKPTVLQAPMLLLPNSTFEVDYSNDDDNNTYRVMMTYQGYRIRIDHAKDLLSTIVG